MRNKILRANLRKGRVRKVINQHCIIPSSGSEAQKRYRLSLHKTGRHIYAQVIDLNEQGKVICSHSTLNYREKQYNKAYCTKEYANRLGTDIGHKILEKNITKISIDRGSNKYVGRIAAFAEAVRAVCKDKASF